MNNQNKVNSQLTQQLSGLIPNFCDKCGAKHNKTDIEIINQDMNGISCRLDCHNCGNSYMMFINSPSDGVMAGKKIQLKTDITSEEMKKYSSLEKIESTEILDALIAFNKVSNIDDFNVLFTEPNKA
jgi:hypothetical protein